MRTALFAHGPGDRHVFSSVVNLLTALSFCRVCRLCIAAHHLVVQAIGRGPQSFFHTQMPSRPRPRSGSDDQPDPHHTLSSVTCMAALNHLHDVLLHLVLMPTPACPDLHTLCDLAGWAYGFGAAVLSRHCCLSWVVPTYMRGYTRLHGKSSLAISPFILLVGQCAPVDMGSNLDG